jgi:hypothetical protein
VVSGTEQNNVSLSRKDFVKAIKVLTALTPEMDCDQMAMGLPPITSAVSLIGKSFW